jgi:2-succinyl-5-enolpyruvyl-6-hydroxy-3-cyclohexene-1-carboxylate synthase
LHLANSSSVRNASYFTWFTSVPKYCNRGVNGIEGSLSTAVGHALAEPNKMVITLIGDLSFFYDNNALFNPHLKGNLRIILFNNKGGQIFQSLPGLSDSPILDTYVVAPHHFSAKGLAESYCIKYLSVEKYEDLDDALPTFLDKDFSRPVLLEVFTSSEDNELERKKIIQYITHL